MTPEREYEWRERIDRLIAVLERIADALERDVVGSGKPR